MGELEGPLELTRLLADPKARVPAWPTGLDEVDRVLGGGLLQGSVTLLGGEPGVGKSTLVLQMAAGLAGRGCKSLIATGEESATQVAGRAARLGVDLGGVWVVPTGSLSRALGAVRALQPQVLVVDSVQTLADEQLEASPGSVSQVRRCAETLVELAKGPGGPAVVLLGHVTKDGSLAGPKVLEHLVDTVLSFEGDRLGSLRVVRATKHRFARVGEVGLLEMTNEGLAAVEDPARRFLGDRALPQPGSVVLASLSGRRPLLVEVQALVVPTAGTSPGRACSGFDHSRLAVLLAVLESRVGLRLGGHEVYLSVSGGVRLSDPGADLAVCMAVASAATGRPLDPALVVAGEIGLAGEVRQVSGARARCEEAARLGFREAVMASAHAKEDLPIGFSGVESVGEALERCLGATTSPPRLKVVGD